MSISSINDGALFGGRREETREDANEIQIHIIDFLHTNLYVVTHMYQFVASLFYPTLFCCGGKANLVRFTLFYSTLLTLTHGQKDGRTDREMNTLASRGLEEPFFQLCCCVSFWFWWEMAFGCTYYYVLGVPYSCGVVLV